MARVTRYENWNCLGRSVALPFTAKMVSHESHGLILFCSTVTRALPFREHCGGVSTRTYMWANILKWTGTMQQGYANIVSYNLDDFLVSMAFVDQNVSCWTWILRWNSLNVMHKLQKGDASFTDVKKWICSRSENEKGVKISRGHHITVRMTAGRVLV